MNMFLGMCVLMKEGISVLIVEQHFIAILFAKQMWALILEYAAITNPIVLDVIDGVSWFSVRVEGSSTTNTCRAIRSQLPIHQKLLELIYSTPVFEKSSWILNSGKINPDLSDAHFSGAMDLEEIWLKLVSLLMAGYLVVFDWTLTPIYLYLYLFVYILYTDIYIQYIYSIYIYIYIYLTVTLHSHLNICTKGNI